MTRGYLAAALLLVTSAAPGLAAVEVVFSGGQSIVAREARRAGDAVYITLPDGTTGSVPASMVVEIRLGADPKPAAPAGRTASPPTPAPSAPPPATPPGGAPAPPRQAPAMATMEDAVLAGAPASSSAPSSAPSGSSSAPPAARPKEPPSAVPQSVGGNPWVPRDDAADSRWVPEGVAWDKPSIDPAWKPESAYGKEDVLAPGRVEWSKPTFDNTWAPQSAFNEGSTWTPTDGFSRFGTSARVAGGGLFASAGAALLRQCGAQVLPAARRVAALDDPPLDRFPLPVYVAEGDRRVLFTVAGGACRPLEGLPAIGAALAALPLREQWAGMDDLALAEGVLRLAGPADRVPLTGAGDVARLAAAAPSSCKLPAAKRPAALAAAFGGVGLARIERAADARAITLYGWSPAGGVVTRERVLVTPDGKVTVERTEIARHVGDHRD